MYGGYGGDGYSNCNSYPNGHGSSSGHQQQLSPHPMYFGPPGGPPGMNNGYAAPPQQFLSNDPYSQQQMAAHMQMEMIRHQRMHQYSQSLTGMPPSMYVAPPPPVPIPPPPAPPPYCGVSQPPPSYHQMLSIGGYGNDSGTKGTWVQLQPANSTSAPGGSNAADWDLRREAGDVPNRKLIPSSELTSLLSSARLQMMTSPSGIKRSANGSRVSPRAEPTREVSATALKAQIRATAILLDKKVAAAASSSASDRPSGESSGGNKEAAPRKERDETRIRPSTSTSTSSSRRVEDEKRRETERSSRHPSSLRDRGRRGDSLTRRMDGRRRDTRSTAASSSISPTARKRDSVRLRDGDKATSDKAKSPSKEKSSSSSSSTSSRAATSGKRTDERREKEPERRGDQRRDENKKGDEKKRTDSQGEEEEWIEAETTRAHSEKESSREGPRSLASLAAEKTMAKAPQKKAPTTSTSSAKKPLAKRKTSSEAPPPKTTTSSSEATREGRPKSASEAPPPKPRASEETQAKKKHDPRDYEIKLSTRNDQSGHAGFVEVEVGSGRSPRRSASEGIVVDMEVDNSDGSRSVTPVEVQGVAVQKAQEYDIPRSYTPPEDSFLSTAPFSKRVNQVSCSEKYRTMVASVFGTMNVAHRKRMARVQMLQTRRNVFKGLLDPEMQGGPRPIGNSVRSFPSKAPSAVPFNATTTSTTTEAAYDNNPYTFISRNKLVRTVTNRPAIVQSTSKENVAPRMATASTAISSLSASSIAATHGSSTAGPAVKKARIEMPKEVSKTTQAKAPPSATPNLTSEELINILIPTIRPAEPVPLAPASELKSYDNMVSEIKSIEEMKACPRFYYKKSRGTEVFGPFTGPEMAAKYAAKEIDYFSLIMHADFRFHEFTMIELWRRNGAATPYEFDDSTLQNLNEMKLQRAKDACELAARERALKAAQSAQAMRAAGYGGGGPEEKKATVPPSTVATLPPPDMATVPPSKPAAQPPIQKAIVSPSKIAAIAAPEKTAVPAVKTTTVLPANAPTVPPPEKEVESTSKEPTITPTEKITVPTSKPTTVVPVKAASVSPSGETTVLPSKTFTEPPAINPTIEAPKEPVLSKPPVVPVATPKAPSLPRLLPLYSPTALYSPPEGATVSPSPPSVPCPTVIPTERVPIVITIDDDPASPDASETDLVPAPQPVEIPVVPLDAVVKEEEKITVVEKEAPPTTTETPEPDNVVKTGFLGKMKGLLEARKRQEPGSGGPTPTISPSVSRPMSPSKAPSTTAAPAPLEITVSFTESSTEATPAAPAPATLATAIVLPQPRAQAAYQIPPRAAMSLRRVNGEKVTKESRICFEWAEKKTCRSGAFCRFRHGVDDESKRVCGRMLRGLCRGSTPVPGSRHAPCDLPHQLLPYQMPICTYFLRCECRLSPAECKLAHIKHNDSTPFCAFFNRGDCQKGNDCDFQHRYLPSIVRELGIFPDSPQSTTIFKSSSAARFAPTRPLLEVNEEATPESEDTSTLAWIM